MWVLLVCFQKRQPAGLCSGPPGCGGNCRFLPGLHVLRAVCPVLGTLLWSTAVWGKLQVPAWAPRVQSCVTCIGSTEREVRGGKESLTSQWIVSCSPVCSPRLLFPHPCPRLSSLGCHDSRALEAGRLMGTEPEFASMYARGGGGGVPSCTHLGPPAHWHVLE